MDDWFQIELNTGVSYRRTVYRALDTSSARLPPSPSYRRPLRQGASLPIDRGTAAIGQGVLDLALHLRMPIWWTHNK